MKNFYLFCLLVSVMSCTSNTGNASLDEGDTAAAAAQFRTPELAEQEQKMKRQQYFIWQVDADKKVLLKNPQLQPEFFNVDTLIAGLNEMFPEIRLEKIRLSNDTLYTEIKDASFLTERSGSLGAEQYIAQAVINLTSVEGIRYVRIDFPEGSHASPDVFSRDQFAVYKEQEIELEQ
jgi:hypothetical protein